MIVAVVDDFTATVVAVKVALELPAEMLTDAGTVTDEELSLRLMVAPVVGAGPVRVTVACEGFPPATDVGARVKVLSVDGGALKTSNSERPAACPTAAVT